MNRRVGLHVVRLAMFVAIIGLIHFEHKRVKQRNANALHSLSLNDISTSFPLATSLTNSEQIANGYQVTDANDQVIGYACQTSPQADHVVGFSGPTNLLVSITPDMKIDSLSILQSEDTEEHVEIVQASEKFFNSFQGVSISDLAGLEVDAVSGATLTSDAIVESVFCRFQIKRESQRFPEPISVDAVKEFFPNANELLKDPNSDGWWIVKNAKGETVGNLLRSSPAADNMIGYQGPSDAFIPFNIDGLPLGFQLVESFDNEPYVGYIKDEYGFAHWLDQQTIETLGELDLKAAGVEGVSGATMTSLNIVEGLKLAAQRHGKQSNQRGNGWLLQKVDFRDCATIVVVLAGMIIGLTSLRGNKLLRLAFQFVLIGYLGLTNGDLISQAMLVGWARHGVPWQSSAGLVVLTLAAFCVPVLTRRNLYCSHLCPHGALQELVKRKIGWQWKLGKGLRKSLKFIPPMLLAWCIVVAMAQLGFSLVDIEPFNAWIFRVAGWATISVALVGLVASIFVPMAYCKFGCPTGALLGFLRFNASSDRWSRQDNVAACLLVLAIALAVV